MVAVAIAIIVLLAGGSDGIGFLSQRTGPPPASVTVSGFAFEHHKVVALRVNRRKPVPDLAAASAAIESSLTSLYGQAVVNRTNWANGPPPAVWNAFAPAIRDRARRDRAAFTIGDSGRLLSRLDISSSDLTIRFLLDDGGHVTAAQAAVSVNGTGEVKGSGAVNLVVRSRLLLQPVDGVWLITGYPAASVTVASPRAPAAPATPATPSGSAP
jgi:hypothetical protein